MPHRQFVDAAGALWAVWDVRPAPATDVRPAPATATTTISESAWWRSRLTATAPGMDNALAAGWLCFESDGEKRRLAPIPTGWEDLPVADLVTLWAAAAGVRRRGKPDSAV